ncbi:hypothetical protein IAT40_002588 [Kwoniella sp. CBS 6097]
MTSGHPRSYFDTYAVRHDPDAAPSDGNTVAPHHYARRGSVTSPSAQSSIPNYSPRYMAARRSAFSGAETDAFIPSSHHQDRRYSQTDPLMDAQMYHQTQRASVQSHAPSASPRQPSRGAQQLSFDDGEDGVDDMTQYLAATSLGTARSAHNPRSPHVTATQSHLHGRRHSQTGSMPAPSHAQVAPDPTFPFPMSPMPYAPAAGFPIFPQPTSWDHPGLYVPPTRGQCPSTGVYMDSSLPSHNHQGTPDYRDGEASRNTHPFLDMSVPPMTQCFGVDTAWEVPDDIKCDFSVHRGDWTIYKHGIWAKVISEDPKSRGQLVFNHTQVSMDEPEGLRAVYLANHTQMAFMSAANPRSKPGTDLSWAWMNFQDKVVAALEPPNTSQEEKVASEEHRRA